MHHSIQERPGGSPGSIFEKASSSPDPVLTSCSYALLRVIASEKLPEPSQIACPVDSHDLNRERVGRVHRNGQPGVRAELLHDFLLCRRPASVAVGIVNANAMRNAAAKPALGCSLEPMRKRSVLHRSPRDPVRKFGDIAIGKMIERIKIYIAMNHLTRKHQRQTPAHRVTRRDR